MNKPRLTTIVVAALALGPGLAAAQDFDDDFDDFDDDFEDFEEDDDFEDFDEVALEEDEAADDEDGEERGLGVGAVVPMGSGGLAAAVGADVFGIGAAPAAAYDLGEFHLDGYIQFSTNGNTSFALGGRFFYHLVEHSRSDLSAGGGLSFLNLSGDEFAESLQTVFIEGSAKIRMFIVPQVSLESSAGLVAAVGDGDGFQLGGQVLGGITYYID